MDMKREPIVFVGTSDLVGAFPRQKLSRRRPGRPAAARRGPGTDQHLHVGVRTHPDHPFGTVGEVFLIPDAATRVHVAFEEGGAAEHFFLGDIRTADGAPWSHCPRQILRRALERLQAEAGVRLLASFEQEFPTPASTARRGSPTISIPTAARASSARRCSPPCARRV